MKKLTNPKHASMSNGFVLKANSRKLRNQKDIQSAGTVSKDHYRDSKQQMRSSQIMHEVCF